MGTPLGFKTFATGDVLTAADTNGYLMQGVWVFASATARDAAVTSPQEGNTCYLKDTDVIQCYSGSSWVTKSATASSSGMTFISRTTFSGTAQANVDGCFTSTYLNYLIIVESLTASTGADDAKLGLRRGTTSSTTGFYSMAAAASYNAAAFNFNGVTNGASATLHPYTDGLSAAINIFNVGTGSSVGARGHGTAINNSTAELSVIGFKVDDLQNWDGFYLKSSSSNVTGAVSVYGLAKA